jgi:hypothetical protein
MEKWWDGMIEQLFVLVKRKSGCYRCLHGQAGRRRLLCCGVPDLAFLVVRKWLLQIA